MADFNTDNALANFDQQTGNGSYNADDALANFDQQTGSGLGGTGQFGYNFNTDDALFNFDAQTSPYSFGGPSAGVYGNTSHPNTTGFQQGLSTINDFFSKNAFGKLANAALGFTPVGRAFNAARGVATALGQGNTMGAIGAGMGAIGGPIGAIGSLATSNNPGASFAGAGGSMLGGMIGGPAGSMIGGQLGGMAARAGGNGQGYNGGLAGGSTDSNGGGYGVENAVGDLAKMYAMSKASSGYGAAKDANSAIQGQISSLSNMYGPNSPYAQQLRQNLERKDAAAGRRSQYGPREVQLQAALADKAAQTAGTIGNLAQQSQNQSLALKNQKDQQRAQQLAMLFKMGQSSGAFEGLNNMFSGGGNSNPVPYETSGWTPQGEY